MEKLDASLAFFMHFYVSLIRATRTMPSRQVSGLAKANVGKKWSDGCFCTFFILNLRRRIHLENYFGIKSLFLLSSCHHVTLRYFTVSRVLHSPEKHSLLTLHYIWTKTHNRLSIRFSLHIHKCHELTYNMNGTYSIFILMICQPCRKC